MLKIIMVLLIRSQAFVMELLVAKKRQTFLSLLFRARKLFVRQGGMLGAWHYNGKESGSGPVLQVQKPALPLNLKFAEVHRYDAYSEASESNSPELK